MSLGLSEITLRFIGCLINKPLRLSRTFIKASYFEGIDKDAAEYVMNVIATNGAFVANDCNDSFNMGMMMQAYDLTDNANDEQFMRYQQIIATDYQKRRFVELVKECHSGKISLNQFVEDVKKLNAILNQEDDYLTADKVKAVLNNPLTLLKFDDQFIFFQKKLCIMEHDLVTIGAGTGRGKSTLALNLMHDLSKNYNCLYLNFEMASSEAILRLTALDTGITFAKLRGYQKNGLTEIEENKLNQFFDDLPSMRMKLVNKSMTLEEVKQTIAEQNQEEHTIVFIDHVGLIGCRAGSLYERMTEIYKELRKCSIDYNCTIFCLCQLNRGADLEAPTLSDLKDSGEIENSSSKVIFLYDKKDQYFLKVDKNRSGKKFETGIKFNKDIQRMYFI